MKRETHSRTEAIQVVRTLLTLALLVAAGLGGTWILAQGGPAGTPVVAARSAPGPAPGRLDEARQLLDRLLPGAADADEADRESIARANVTTFYQWVDDTGSVHFVQKLEDVPPAWRDQVGRIEVENRPTRAASARPGAKRAAPKPYAAVAARPEVVVYTTSWCGWCRRTIAWLDEAGVGYVNKDIERDDRWRAELIQKTGRTTIPVVEIDGQLVQGFDPERMGQLL